MVLPCYKGWKSVPVTVLFFFFIYSTKVAASGIGKCPRYMAIPEFNLSKFTGQWFEVERSFYVMEVASSCTTFDFALSLRRHLNVFASSLNRWTGNSSNVSGVAIPMFQGSSIMRFKVNTKLPFSIARMLPGAGIYNILYTDYENVAIVWTCSTFAMAYTDRFWILGRYRDIPASTRIDIYNRIKKYNLDTERLIISKNENCPDIS